MSKSNILFVDDEPAILSSLRMLFKDDYNVFTAESGAAGLEILRKMPIKVVISDQRMPNMLGHEFLRQAKAISPLSIRMLLTGYSDLESIMNSVNAGEIFRYINKPWKTETLEKLVALGVQIYDRVSTIRSERQPQDGNDDKPSKIHIEVEEKSNRVLFVDYSPDEVKRLLDQLGNKLPAVGVTTIDDAFRELSQRPVSVIVSNVNFSDYDPFDFLKAVQREYPEIITVILTELSDAQLAIRSINEVHAFKYLVKPQGYSEIETALQEALQRSKPNVDAPTKEVQRVAEEVAPPELKPMSSAQESELRLRLRSLQNLLARK